MYLDEGRKGEREAIIATQIQAESETAERPEIRIKPDAITSMQRPGCRAECATVPRPCPFVSCRYHLYLDVNPRTGTIKFNFPGLGVSQIAVSCALDVAEAGPWTLEEIGGRLNITRERARQLAEQALAKIRVGLEE
ncbi:MAG: sigma factor-like helix-turn-helix DNA-binding protein [Pseudomonadota bacterium]